MNPHESQNDERLDAWRDTMTGEDARPGDAEDLSTEQQRQLADEQLLHALLRRHYSDAQTADAKRMDRVRKAITPRPTRPLWFRLLRASLSSAAALVLVVILIEVLRPQPTSATSDFQRVVSAFMSDGDRTYSVRFTMQQLPPDDSDRSTDARPPARPPRRPGRGRFENTTLYLRGSDQYVFEIKLPRDKTAWIGQNGQSAWAVRPFGAVLVSKDPDAFRLPFFEEMTTIPLIDVRDTLQAARHGYRLEPPQTVTMEDGRRVDYFVARREGRQGRHPQRIELWADPQSGLLYRIVCSTMHFGGMVCHQMRMDYLTGAELPADWFDYRGHVSSNAKVKTVTREDIRRFRRRHHKKRREPWNRRPHHRAGPPRRDPSRRFAPPDRPEE